MVRERGGKAALLQMGARKKSVRHPSESTVRKARRMEIDERRFTGLRDRN
jgi:hypothetical protein